LQIEENNTMIFGKLTTHIRLVAFTVLLLQAAGLAICPDSRCLEGESEEICQTALCSALDNAEHEEPTEDVDREDSCQCACFVSYNIPEVVSFSHLLSDNYVFSETHLTLSTPVIRIDHIPRA